MLVLTRRPGESIVVGQNIIITVIEIKGGQVRIGIDAPAHVPIRRRELAPMMAPVMAPVDDGVAANLRLCAADDGE